MKSTMVGTGNAEARDAWVKKLLKAVPQGSRILDAGAGTCQYKKFCEHLIYTSQDFCQYIPDGSAGGLVESRWDYSKIDIVSEIYNIPREDKSFDIVLCTEVLEHIVDPVAAIRELHRLLAGDGMLILTAPFNSLEHQVPHYYYSGFSRQWYEYWLPKIGFRIKSIEPNGNYYSVVAQEVRRIYDLPDSVLKKEGLTRLILNEYEYYSKNNKNFLTIGCHGFHVVAIKE